MGEKGKGKRIDQVNARRMEVSKGLLRGERHIDMSARLGVSRSQITQDVAAIRQQWVNVAVLEYDQHIAQEIERLNAVIAAAWDSWDKSKRPKKRTSRKGSAKGSSDSDTIEVVSFEQGAGNPRFLEIIIKAHERICALMGLDAAMKVEISTPDGGPLSADDARDDAKVFYIG